MKPKLKRIRYRGREKKMDVIQLNDKFVAAGGAGKAKRFRRR